MHVDFNSFKVFYLGGVLLCDVNLEMEQAVAVIVDMQVTHFIF